MSVTQKQVQILGTSIRENSDGGFLCVNDLWKASGAHPNDRPSKWLRTAKTKEYIKLVDQAHKRASVFNFQQGNEVS